MDIQRTDTRSRRHRRLLAAGAVGLGFVVLTGMAISLANRPPGIDGSLIYHDEVRRGEFAHEVTASGTLISPDIRSVTNRSAGIVERVHFLAGESVKPHDVIVELSSPQLHEELADAESNLAAAEADEEIRRIEARDSLFQLESTLADAEAAYETARLEFEAEQLLYENEASSDIVLQSKRSAAERTERQRDRAQAQLERYPQTSARRDEAAEAKLQQQKRKVEQLKEKIRDLEVRAGITGDILEINVEEGQRLSEGTDVARIVNQDELIARVKVSERDAAMVLAGQPVRLEMGREVVAGRVTRVEPTVQDRLVTVDVELIGQASSRLRANLSVTARIEIQRVQDTLVLQRPAGIREDQETVELFRLSANGRRAERVTVELGRESARHIEVLSGVQAGDRVIIADMTDWLEEPVIRIR